DKREALMKKFDKKHYWLRRKFKTSQLRKNDTEKVESLLKEWDQTVSQKREIYVQDINQKYPHTDLSQNTIQKTQQEIDKLNQRKEKQLEKMNANGKKLQKRVDRFLKHNASKIEKLENKNNKLVSLILKYNSKRNAANQFLLKHYQQKLTNLNNAKSEGKNISEKRIDKYTNNIDNIKTVTHMFENENVHLSISNLKMYFGGVKAVNDLTFDVHKGEIFGLIGPNGAGKTTVFNCITQFYKATSGNMILRNKENHIVDLYDYKTHDMIKEGIARSFQNVELIWELTVLDNLLVAAHSLLITSFFDHMAHTPKLLREDKVIRTKGYQILQTLGIEEYAFRSPYGLPYGILKKIELARTLMTNPSLIILDEPAAGLNDVETIDLAKVIKKVNKDLGITIFLVEHDMGLVMSLCDRICAISFGKLIGLGTPKEIQSNPEVRKAYLGDDDNE
ncbi:MAG: ATP-binding cassette domain-containing protein, partial [Acholeplasmataceae bacterium]